MARYGFSWKRLVKRIISYLFWMTLRLVSRNGFRILKGIYNFIFSFDRMTPDILEASRILSSTPQYQKMNQPRGFNRTGSSNKRSNKGPASGDFNGRTRRGLFSPSLPGKFILENDRTSKIPRRKKPTYDSLNQMQNRPRI